MANIIYWNPGSGSLSSPKSIFVDTTHILASITPDHADYDIANDFNEKMLDDGHTFITSPVVINETWNRLEHAKATELLKKKDLRSNASSLKDKIRQLENIHGVDIKSEIIDVVIQTMSSLTQDWLTVVSIPEHNYVEKISKTKKATPHDLEVFDNSHLIFMDGACCNTIVTQDASFEGVKGLNVIKVVSNGNPKTGKGRLIEYEPDFYL